VNDCEARGKDREGSCKEHVRNWNDRERRLRIVSVGCCMSKIKVMNMILGLIFIVCSEKQEKAGNEGMGRPSASMSGNSR
jgi:hypothetical protein